MSRYKQGVFTPENPKKYVGNIKNIVYRSRWEFEFMKYLDKHPEVLKWSSEEVAIPYLYPIKKLGKRRTIRKYYPDFLIETVNGKYLIEIKPLKETKPPRQKKDKRRFLYETATYEINKAKWEAATKWCKRNGIKFQVMTEKELGITYRKKLSPA